MALSELGIELKSFQKELHVAIKDNSQEYVLCSLPKQGLSVLWLLGFPDIIQVQRTTNRKSCQRHERDPPPPPRLAPRWLNLNVEGPIPLLAVLYAAHGGAEGRSS